MLSFGMSEARAGSPMRARSERRPRRRALSRDARGDSQLCLPLPTAAAASISPVTSSTPECDDSPPSPPPQPSSGDLRWLLDLDLTCYSIFALCLVISAFATRERRARLLSLAIAAACALFAAAAAPLARRGCSRRRRDLTAFAFRALFAAAINPMMAGGLPRGGRLVGAFLRRPHGAREHALLGPDSEAPVGLSHGARSGADRAAFSGTEAGVRGRAGGIRRHRRVLLKDARLYRQGAFREQLAATGRRRRRQGSESARCSC